MVCVVRKRFKTHIIIWCWAWYTENHKMAVPRSKTDTIVPKDVLFIPAGYGVYCHILEAIGYKQKLAVVLASVYRPPPLQIWRVLVARY